MYRSAAGEQTDDPSVADEGGTKRRRADYLVLRALEGDSYRQEDLEEVVWQVVKDLLDEDVEPPIDFRHSSSPNGVFSRDFLEALERGLRMNRIREVDSGVYELTGAGEDFLEDYEQLALYGVTSDFREAVDRLVDRRE